jgi:glycerol kinase
MNLGVIDVGTTSMKLIIYDDELNHEYQESINVPMLFPRSYYAEQDAEALKAAFNHLLNTARSRDVRLIGISTYRASIIVWDRSGNPLTNIITWLDRRGLEVINKFPLSLLKHVPPLSSILVSTSPAVQILWLKRNRGDLLERIKRGDAYVGTLSSFLAFLISGKYINDATNEALTGLWNPSNFRRIKAVYDVLGIPEAINPDIVDNIYDYGNINGIDIGVMIADQQAAMVGEGCMESGCGKVTNGTGSFVDAATNEFKIGSGLLPLLMLKVGNESFYGVEGFLPATGSVIDWLTKLGLISAPEELDKLAGVGIGDLIVVPALAGVNVPQRPCARGLIDGLTLGVTRESFVRAVMEGLVQLIGIIFDKIRNNANVNLLRVDGGLSRSTLFLKLLATALNIEIERQRDVEVTARGVAAMLNVFHGKWGFRDLIRGIHVDPDIRVKPNEEKVSLNRDTIKKIVVRMKCK